MGKLYSSAIIILLFLFIVSNSNAETYRGIGPLDTLSDLKAKFPSATFTKQNPAWAQEYDVMYEITGVGMSGTIVVVFFDNRPYFRKLMAEEQDETKKQNWKQLADAPDDEITVSWVRWVPDLPFPVTRLVTKYGKPDKSDFAEEDYQPYKSWLIKGLDAYLSDDGKNVTRIDFHFTNKEQRDAWKKKYRFVPEFLSKDKKIKKIEFG